MYGWSLGTVLSMVPIKFQSALMRNANLCRFAIYSLAWPQWRRYTLYIRIHAWIYISNILALVCIERTDGITGQIPNSVNNNVITLCEDLFVLILCASSQFSNEGRRSEKSIYVCVHICNKSIYLTCFYKFIIKVHSCLVHWQPYTYAYTLILKFDHLNIL